ncbi:tetratricopeptide repeat protein [candidate division WOR-3 bacterium]|nr:tetratricopeptide repeat protein [candidate division WOR-3 bacterium]
MEISEQEKKLLKLFSKKIEPTDSGSHNNLAVVYYNKGLVKEAVEELKKALGIDPHFTLAKNNLDYIYRSTGFYDEQIERLKNKMEREPDDFESRLELARAYKSIGNYYEAINQYSKYLRQKPSDVQALLDMGVACKASGFYEPSVEQFKKVIRLDKNNDSAHKYLGEVYYNLGMFSSAIEELKTAIRLNPKDAESYYLLSFTYGEEGKFDEATKAAKKAINLNPRFAKTEANLSLGLYKRKGYEDFLSVSKDKIEANPSFGFYAMGLAYKNKGLFKESLQELKKAVKADPSNSLVREQIGEVYLFMGDNEEAIKAYLEALKQDPDLPKLANNIGIAYHRLGKLEDAISWYKRAISKDLNYAVSWNNLGVAYYHSGAPKEAFNCLKRAKEINPEYSDPYLNIGLVYMTRGNYESAERFFKKVIEMKGENPLPFNYLGSVYLSLERFEDAIYFFRMAVERDDSFAEALYNLGFALSRIGKYDEALEATKKAMEIDPYYSSNRFKLGVDIYSERLGILVARELTKDMEVGRVAGEETAEDFFGDLFEAPREEIEPEVDIKKEINKAAALLKENKLNEALEVLSEARNVEPENEELLLLLGKVYEKKDLLGEAKDVLRVLVPSNLEASKLLTKIYQENKEWDSALALAKELNRKYPEESFPYIASAQYLKTKKKYNKAIELLKTFPAWQKENGILLELASINFKLGKKKTANSFIEKSLSISPSAEGYYQLSNQKVREGDLQGAIEALSKAKRLAPKDKRILKALVKTCLVAKNYDAVIKSAKEAKEVIKADGDLALWEAKALYNKDEIDAAVNSLKQAVGFDSKNFEAYHLLASLYFKQGRYKEAEDLWNNIVNEAKDEKVLGKARQAIESLLRLRNITGEI